MSASKTIFTCGELIKACEQAIADGEGLGKVFVLDTKPRDGPNGVKYLSLSARVPGKSGRLFITAHGELHKGRINPLDASEVDRLNSEPRNTKYGLYKKREYDPNLSIRKYKIDVDTDDNNNPLLTEEHEDNKSEYFQVIEYLNKFFEEECERHFESKLFFDSQVRHKGQTLPSDSIIVGTAKVVSLIQSTISYSAKENAGQALANPITRTPKLKFNKNDGLPARNLKFYDLNKPIFEAKKDEEDGEEKQATKIKGYESLLLEGEPVTANNIHKIRSRSTVNFIATADSVCISQMGISIPITANVVMIKAPEDDDKELTDQDIMDSMLGKLQV